MRACAVERVEVTLFQFCLFLNCFYSFTMSITC